MPELPDIVVYIEALRARIIRERLERLRIASPFLLRSVDPRPEELAGRVVRRVERLGKRIVLCLDDEYFVIEAERSEEHTSELQSQSKIVCRLLLEKKKNTMRNPPSRS